MISIRFAQSDDIPSITELDSLATPGSRRVHLIQRAIDEQACFVAELDSDIAGYAMFSRCFFDNMFLELIVVGEGYRRRGVAKALVNHIQRISTTTKLFTSTNRSNHAAHELFHSCGFEESGYIDNLDTNDPEIVYFKLIDRPNT